MPHLSATQPPWLDVKPLTFGGSVLKMPGPRDWLPICNMQDRGLRAKSTIPLRSSNPRLVSRHATLHSVGASKEADSTPLGGDRMQFTSTGFSLSQILSAERVRMRTALKTRTRASRRVLNSAKGDELCTLFDEAGQFLGTVLHPEGRPQLGPNEETVFLQRDN